VAAAAAAAEVAAVLPILLAAARNSADGPTALPLRVLQVRFCRYRFSPYRRVRIQRDQGRGGLGHRSTVLSVPYC
jgi:hypothetical protein